jgi:serine phosphatase RsbU (regulator of sigma subunit)
MYIFTDGITEIKNPEGNELDQKDFKIILLNLKINQIMKD